MNEHWFLAERPLVIVEQRQGQWPALPGRTVVQAGEPSRAVLACAATLLSPVNALRRSA
jgi:hypothetical protein